MKLLIFSLIISLPLCLFSQGGSNCSTMEPICTDIGLNFTANSGVPEASTTDPGNDYDCLNTQPNPTWYYFEIATNGNIDMNLTAPSDIDYIIWGPFSSISVAQAACGDLGNPPSNNVIDCSFSSTNNEFPSIPFATAGQVYVMLITNYADVVQNVTLSQVGGTGSTNCTIVTAPNCAMSAFDVNVGGCEFITNTYDISGSIEYTDPPTSGSLVVEDCNGNIVVVDTYPFAASPQLFNLNNLNADGLACDVTAYFTADLACTQIYNYTAPITDPIMPTASNPLPINVECIADVPVVDESVVTDEADNNGTPTVAWVSDVSDNGTCPEIITRTYSVTDACGNSINVTQTITVLDITNPVLAAAPANVTVSCAADIPAMVSLTWIDNCDGTSSVIGTDASDGNICPETITRTWTYIDACGNPATTTQTIIVHDLVAPVLAAAPANVTVECIGDVPIMTDIAWTDNCDGSGTVSGIEGGIVGSECGGTITRTWTYTDACGNPATTTQTITIDDNTLPTASNPTTTTVPGGPAPAVDVTIVIDEADNCSVPVVAFVSESTDGGVCPETITRIYSVTDACGNTINVTHTILITDPIMPTASNPLPITVECIGDVPLPDVSVVIDAADNNGIPLVEFVIDISDNGSCPELITRMYSVTDACGNAINVAQTITVIDTTNPTASNPAPIFVECINDIPTPNSAVVSDAVDNCMIVPIITFVSDVSDNGTCPENITRTYSVTDNCGNSILVTQTISVMDVTAPTASNPITINLDASQSIPAPNISVVTDASDNCTSNPIILFVSDVTDGQKCPETITRTYSIMDECGNITLVNQTIILNVGCEIVIPSAFTPNGDQSNDVWEIVDIDLIYPNNKVFVYNRWGNLLFESATGNYALNPWNGRINGEQLPVASYFYIIFAEGDKSGDIFKGTVSIIKN